MCSRVYLGSSTQLFALIKMNGNHCRRDYITLFFAKRDRGEEVDSEDEGNESQQE